MAVKPRNLILNLLLAAREDGMQARDAVAACALFGLRENTVRVALTRLAAEGMIEAAGRGAYRLGPAALPLASDVATWRTALTRLAGWKEGHWVAVHSGALGRSDRVALRRRERAFAMLGLRELEKGLYLRPDNLLGGVAGVRQRLQALGLEPEASVFGMTDLDERRERVARALWDGGQLNRSYREHGRRLRQWLERAGELEPEAAAREAFLLGNEAIRTLVFDPLLPAPLVDECSRREFADAVTDFDAAGKVLWQSLQLLPAGAGMHGLISTH